MFDIVQKTKQSVQKARLGTNYNAKNEKESEVQFFSILSMHDEEFIYSEVPYKKKDDSKNAV